MLQWVLHCWGDYNCVKVLRKCKEAIPAGAGAGGKVIIIDAVMGALVLHLHRTRRHRPCTMSTWCTLTGWNGTSMGGKRSSWKLDSVPTNLFHRLEFTQLWRIIHEWHMHPSWSMAAIAICALNNVSFRCCWNRKLWWTGMLWKSCFVWVVGHDYNAIQSKDVFVWSTLVNLITWPRNNAKSASGMAGWPHPVVCSNQ